MLREEVIKEWEKIKEIILSSLDTYKITQEQMINRYEEKIRKKDTLIHEFESQDKLPNEIEIKQEILQPIYVSLNSLPLNAVIDKEISLEEVLREAERLKKRVDISSYNENLAKIRTLIMQSNLIKLREMVTNREI